MVVPSFKNINLKERFFLIGDIKNASSNGAGSPHANNTVAGSINVAVKNTTGDMTFA